MSIISEKGFHPQKVTENGNKFLTGNGYLGYRGTLDEFTAEQCVGLNVAGFYDGLEGKWRETVNVFNPFLLTAHVGSQPLDVRNGSKSHATELNLQTAVFSRETQFAVENATVTLKSRRFVSLACKNLLCSQVEVVANKDLTLTIFAGVDPTVWDLNGPHLVGKRESFTGDVSKISAVAQQSKTHVSVQCKFSVLPKSVSGSIGRFEIQLQKDVPFVLDRIAFVLVGEEIPFEISFDQALSDHVAAWQAAWQNCGVTLDDPRANLALEYSIYHLITLAPQGNYSIAARGLSGQTYKGAVFWDTEIYLLPFYLHTMPSVAQKIVQYRVDTLEQAKQKARHYGFGGAFYAWESQYGFDACSDFNVVDAFTHRPVRTYFKDKQIHISADVAYAVLEYYHHTGDDEFMLCGGLQTVLECAEFARTYSYFNHVKGRFELLDVIGPDEYHERVNNNAFTNYAFYFATTYGLKVAKRLQNKYPQRFSEISAKLPDLSKLRSWAKKLYLPQPDENGVIEQFDGYFDLEDVFVETVRSRLVKPNEYWGGTTGVATATRVIKQADVIVLFNMFPEKFSKAVQQANYNFYLPYTEHGSSLSQCAYALTACRIGDGDGAYQAFLNSAEIDLVGGGKQWAGDLYIGGTHPAASGGAWQAAVLGFAGLRVTKSGKLLCTPSMPKQLNSITFSAVERGNRRKINVTNKETL